MNKKNIKLYLTATFPDDILERPTKEEPMSSKKVFTGKLPCGVEYELHEATAFSDRTEIALMVKVDDEYQIVSLIATERKRTGYVDFKPGHTRKVTVKIPKDSPLNVPTGPKPPTLDDIVTTAPTS